MFYAVCSLLALGLLALDQWSKAWITANLPLGETMDFLPGDREELIAQLV